MDHLVKLFKLMQFTRSMPQTGYVLAGVKKNELSDLAQHHYLVSFYSWQITRSLNSMGAKLDLEKVLEYAMIHDIGEIFGSDIPWPYGKANRRAYRAAKQFEAENHKFLSRYFGSGKKEFMKEASEILDAKSDEAILVKIADYIECLNYKNYTHSISRRDKEITKKSFDMKLKKMKDPVAKKGLSDFIKVWLGQIDKNNDEEDILNF